MVPNFLRALNPNALAGARIGVPRRVFLDDSITGNDPSVNVAFEEALNTIRHLGATVIDPADLPSADEIAVSNNETIVLDVDFKVSLYMFFFSYIPSIHIFEQFFFNFVRYSLIVTLRLFLRIQAAFRLLQI